MLQKNRQSTANRAYALDALRGLAILAMVLSGLVPHGLPAWMYHAQDAPPTHATNVNLPGITWVDLVFPFFLFALGAAIPLAMQRRLEAGQRRLDAVLAILKRGFLLLFFAVFQQHVNPFSLASAPGRGTWLLALAGFVTMFLILVRMPGTMPPLQSLGLRALGWLGAILILAMVQYPDKSGFSIHRANAILAVLANVAVAGSLLWLCTHGQTIPSLMVLIVLLAFRTAKQYPGWVSCAAELVPVRGLIEPRFLKYLFIVIPGTMAGRTLLEWMRDAGPKEHSWNRTRTWTLLALMAGSVIVNLVGLKARWIPATIVLNLVLCAAGWLITRNAGNADERMLRGLFRWGVFWLLLGMVFEPAEGGIKKTYANMSYYFVTTGLSLFTLILFSIVIDLFGKRRWVQLLIDNGQNPMIAYVGSGNLIAPLLGLVGLSGISGWLAGSPWAGAVWATFLTLFLALVVSRFTKRGWFWRT